MVNQKAFPPLPPGRFAWLPVALAAAFCAAGPAAAQRIVPGNVLDEDEAHAVEHRRAPDTARRAIAPRVPAALSWTLAQGHELLRAVETAEAEGLSPGDYSPQGLRDALGAGAGPRLDSVASATFTALATDLRDGRTPAAARRTYFMTDPDADRIALDAVMQRALANDAVASELAALNPSHPDFAALKAALAQTPPAQAARRAAIRANMDRWRWLPRDLGGQHLIVNVPEFRLRLNVNGQTVRSYRTIVGRPGRTGTPQLAEMVEGVIFNPNWTVPQSIVVGEGLGRRVLSNPRWAREHGYTATRGAGGGITVVQAPGPANSLGKIKLDMPNKWAIFLHDTPNKALFNQDNRALSHGCVRVENAMELALTLGLLGEGAEIEEALRIAGSGEYKRVPLARQIPVYIVYFTMGRDEQGQLVQFADLYGRDPVLLESLARPSGNRLRAGS